MAAGQERVMEKAAFDAVVSTDHQQKVLWKGEKYRMTVTTSTKAVGRPQTDYSSKMVIEFSPGPGPESRTVTTSTFGDKPETRYESMRVGEWLYSRSGEGPWSRKEYVAKVGANEEKESDVDVVRSESRYSHLGAGSLADKPVQIYRKTEHRTMTNKSSGRTTESDVTVTYWVDQNGIVLKNVYVSDNRGAAVTSSTHIVMDWELDPSISFTVPEIVP